VLIFVVARSRLDRYEELRRHFEDWRDVRVVLDRREGERRSADRMVPGRERRRFERRHRLDVDHEMSKLGWCVVDSDGPISYPVPPLPISKKLSV